MDDTGLTGGALWLEEDDLLVLGLCTGTGDWRVPVISLPPPVLRKVLELNMFVPVGQFLQSFVLFYLWIPLFFSLLGILVLVLALAWARGSGH